MPVLRISALYLILMSIILDISAQERPLDLFRLEKEALNKAPDSVRDQVIAASRSLRNVGDLPVTVYVITRDEIIGNGYTTLVDALASLPGVRVSQPGSAKDGETFQIRGIYGNYYCKILLDGVDIAPSVTGGMPIGSQLPIRQAERIEVIFGPSSSVYGSEALAGVINIVTHQSDRPVTAQADIALGSEGFEYLNVSIGGKVGRNKNVMTYSLFGGNTVQRKMNIQYDKDYLYNPSLYDSTYSFLDEPYFRGDSSSILMNRMPLSSNILGVSFKWRGWTFQGLRMGRSAHSSIGRDPSVFRYNDPLNFWSESIQRYSLSYSRKWAKLFTESNLAWLNYRLSNQSSFGMLEKTGETGEAYKYSASDDILLEEQLTFLPAKGLELIAGLTYQYSGNLPVTNNLGSPFETDDYHPFSTDIIQDTSILGDFGYNPVTFHRGGAYLHFSYQIKRFTFFGGFRTEYHSLFDFSHSPRIALMYRPDKDLSFRASFSTGSRVPSLYYMYHSEAQREGNGVHYSIVPNTDLDPEKIISAEFGVRWNRLQWLDFDASLFYHQIYDQFTLSFILIDKEEYPVAVNPSGLAQAYVNDGESMARLIGLQANLGFDRLITSIGLDADLNLTLAKGVEVLPNDLGTIDDYRQMPVFLGQLNFSLQPVNRLKLFVRNHLSSGWVRGFLPLEPEWLRSVGYPVDIGGYYTLDVHARIIIGRNFEAYAQFNNVTNEHYGGIDAYSDQYDLFYNPQYGFNFRIGFNFRME